MRELVGTLLLLIILMTSPADSIPYQVTSQGFLNVLNRSEPLVLFRTMTGIQALTANHTCIDNKNSVYYTVNKEIEYFSYSSEENYMLMINSDKMVCFRNLYKSDWNNAMKRDIRRECGKHNYANTRLYGLSINHHVVFSLTNNKLHYFSMNSPMCGTDLRPGEDPRDVLHGVTFLHVTNFVRRPDCILLAYSEKLQEWTPGGHLVQSVNLVDPGERLVSIDSDEAAEHTYFFLYIQNRSDAILRRFTNSINDSASVVIFSAADRTAQSIDVSSGLMALLMRERHYKSDQDRTDDKFTEGDYVLTLRGSYPSHDNESLTTYVCDADAADLDEVIMVNRRKQRDRFFCEDNMLACQSLGKSKMCDYDVILVPQHQFYMDETLTEKELHRKMLFIGIIGLLAFATLLCYAFAKSAWRI